MAYKSLSLLCLTFLSSHAWAQTCAPVAESCESLPTGQSIISECYKFENVEIPGLQQKELNIQSLWSQYSSEDKALSKLVQTQRLVEAKTKADENMKLVEKIDSDSQAAKNKATEVAAQISHWADQSQSEASNYITAEQQQAQAATQRMDMASAQRHTQNAEKGQACLKAIPQAEAPLDQAVQTLTQKFETHSKEAQSEKQNLESKIDTIEKQMAQEDKEEAASADKKAAEAEEVAKGKEKKITRYGYENDPHMDSYTKEGIGKFSEKDPSIRSAAKKSGDTSLIKQYDQGKKNEFYKQDTLLREGDIALSPDLAKGLAPMQPIDVTYTRPDGSTYTLQGRFADTTADNLTGRVDLYDPNGNHTSIDGATVTKITKSTKPFVQPDAAFRSFKKDWRGGFAGDYAGEKTEAPAKTK